MSIEGFDSDIVADLRAEIERIAAVNDRLRALVKSVEYNDLNIGDSSCPWCSVFQGRAHKAECAAFTPDGKVK